MAPRNPDLAALTAPAEAVSKAKKKAPGRAKSPASPGAQARVIMLILLAASSAFGAENLKFSCAFERSALRITDLDAKPWHDAIGSKIEFVLHPETKEIVKQPDTTFWGAASTAIDAEELRITWPLRIEPKARLPTIHLHINRFSGRALQVFTMLPRQRGSEQALWSRSGKCIVRPQLF